MNMKKCCMILATAGLFTLTACEKTREQFDFSKKAPDEFAVTTRAPLEMPADLASLPPPRPGAPRPQEQSTDRQAKQALLGAPGAEPAGDGSVSEGEAVLLERTQALQADPSIRNTIDAETQELVKENTSTFDRIMGRFGRKTDVPAEVVDPVKETERLRANQQSGAPVTQGATPTNER
jgi:hypothetical protein